MKQCLNCSVEIIQIEGKREKKFCSDKCRTTYWTKNKVSKDPKYVQYKTFLELKERLEVCNRNK